MEARGRAGLNALAALAALAAGCPRASTSVVDGGPPGLPAVELRAALMLVFPEFRGAHVESASASFERAFDAPDAATLREAAEGTPRLEAPFEARVRWQSGLLVESVSLPLSDDDVGHIFAAGRSLTTEQLERRLSVRSGVRRRAFTLDLTYQASPARAQVLVDQLVRGLTLAGWTREPQEANGQVVLAQPTSGGRIWVEPAPGRVHLRYEQVLR